MKSIDNKQLDAIKGGNTTISGPIINAIVNVIKVLQEAGFEFG